MWPARSQRPGTMRNRVLVPCHIAMFRVSVPCNNNRIHRAREKRPAPARVYATFH